MSTGRCYLSNRKPTKAGPSKLRGLRPYAHASVRLRRRAVNLLVVAFVLAGLSPCYVSADFTKDANPGFDDEGTTIPRKRTPMPPQEDEALARADRLYNEVTMPQNSNAPWRYHWVVEVSLVVAIGLLAGGYYYLFRVRPTRRC